MAQIGIHLQQKQGLVISQQMQQSLKLLQMNNQELAEFILNEIEQNPVLEQSEPSEDAPENTTETQATEETEATSIDTQIEARTQDEPSEDNYNSDQYEASLTDFSASGDYDKQAFLQNIEDDRPSLRTHLTEQILLDFYDEYEQIIALQLTDMLDESGYFTADVKEVAKQLGITVPQLRNMIIRLQACDPAGIFATSLAECLELQLKERNRFDPAMKCLLLNLDVLAQGDMKKLQKACGVDEEDLRDMIRELRTLNPKPAADFLVQSSVAIPPDVVMRSTGEEGWVVELNYGVLPPLSLNQPLYKKLKTTARNDDDKKFISEKYQQANWLVRSVSQRSDTLLKVATAIMQEQQAFIDEGVMHIKAMVLRDISEKLGLHESTIGRVIANKTIATPRGVYELKYFFSSAIAREDGEDGVSSTAIKHRIRQMIDSEDATHILSDDAIAELLNKENIPISRRTVAKYREAMELPTSAERKRNKRARIA